MVEPRHGRIFTEGRSGETGGFCPDNHRRSLYLTCRQVEIGMRFSVDRRSGVHSPKLHFSLNEKRTAGLPVVYTLTGGCRYYAGPAKYHADDNACTPLLPFDNARVLRTVSKRP